MAISVGKVRREAIKYPVSDTGSNRKSKGKTKGGLDNTGGKGQRIGN